MKILKQPHLAALALAVSLCASSAAAGETSYLFVDLGTLGGPGSAAWGLNDGRQVVGWSYIDDCTAQGHPCRRAFLWEDGVMTDLGLLSGDEESFARAINNSGLVVGTSESDVLFGSGTFHGFQWDGSMSALPDLGLGQSFAHDVNDAGLIVGHAQDPTVVRDRAVTWLAGSITDIGAGESHAYNRGYGVSEAGLVIGWAWNLLQPNDAILNTAGSWKTIGGIDGPFQNAEAYDVNDNGVAVGLQAFPSGSWHAALWTKTGTIDAGVLPGFDYGELFDVNEAGLAVGGCYTGNVPVESRAVLWDGTQLLNLNDLIPAGTDAVLWEAREINEAGDIAGSAVVGGELHAFLLVENPWQDLGGGAPGLNGVPTLTATGSLIAETSLTLDLVNTPPNALTLFWISATSVPFPVAGGTIYATPKDLSLLLLMDPAGSFHIELPWAAGVPSDADIYFQFIVQDGSVPAGITLSNAVTATTP
jgi:probable HAF family extracellular repeat protein